MSLQQVRQLFEGPVVIAMAGATPPVPIYVDNQIFTDADAAKEHAIVRVDFGLTTEETLQENHERLRGVVTVEIYTLKGRGPGRAQELATLVAQALNNVNSCGPNPATGVYGRVRAMEGPSFFPLSDTPHYLSRLSCSFQAAYN